MPKISATAFDPKDFMKSSLIYGVSRAGKTVIGATFPRPVIFTSAREGGYVSVQTMDRSMWYEPDQEPIIFAVSDLKETVPHFNEVVQLAKKGRVKTVVVELSFYSEDVVQAIGKRTDGSKDGWAKYRLLDEHIQWIDKATKGLGLRIAYNTLAVPPGDVEKKSPAGIMVAGRAIAAKLPAGTEFTAYLRTEDKGNNQIDRLMHLVAYGPYPAGHRYGNKLPNLVRNPTYRILEDLFTGKAVADDDGRVLYGEEMKTFVMQRNANKQSDTQPQTNTTSGELTDLSSDLPPLA